MMDKISKFLKENVNENMFRLILSGSRKSDGPSKVKIRPVRLRDGLYYQASETWGTKVLHNNYTKEELISYVEEKAGQGFSQIQLQGETRDGSILISKKGTVTVKTRLHPREERTIPTEHNRKKKYLLEEGTAVPFLQDLGVMTQNGKIVAKRYDKFRQINRFLEFIEDILPQLPRDRTLKILDFGCGKSYLTFAMYYYLKQVKGYSLEIIGLDLKEDVISKCNELAQKYGYENLHFYQGDIASYEGADQVDLVVTLHACDTATDYALAKAVSWNAGVILSVPCCQHELNRQMENEMLEPVLSYGILKERMAALITDGLRAKLLEEAGYEVQILEFIDMEHTPKNLLIRAVKKGKRKKTDRKLETCMEALHVNPTLKRLLEEQKGEG